MTSIPEEFKKPRTKEYVLKDIQDVAQQILDLERYKYELWAEYETNWLEDYRSRLN